MSKEGMATQALAGEIAAAVLADENDGGCDISVAPVDQLETMARQMFEAQADKLAAPWNRQWEPTKENWRKKAAAALKASTPAAPGIDLRSAILQLRDDAMHMKDPGDTVNAYDLVLRLIDASPKGVINPEWSLHDRVEFALRDAGFDLDEAAFVAEAASVANGDLDSPKGGSTSDCPIIRLAPGEYTDWEKRVWRRGVIECATQPDIAAAMQATSAEVGA